MELEKKKKAGTAMKGKEGRSNGGYSKDGYRKDYGRKDNRILGM